MWNLFPLTLILLASFVEVTQALPSNNSEDRLLHYILKDYNPKVRPLRNVSNPVKVRFRIALQQIINLDFQHQILTMHVWITTNWRDEFVKWNPSDFEGLKWMSVDSDMLWVPDIQLYNSASHKHKKNGLGEELKKNQIVIYHDGKTLWGAPAVLSSSCKVDAPHFPFDDQKCSLVFGSYVLGSSKMDLDIDLPYIDKAGYAENEEWSFYRNKVERVERKYNCCSSPFPNIRVTIFMKRRPAFFVYNLILPCGVLTVISLFSFILPPNSGERVSFIMTVLVALSVYMMIVNEEMPHSAETSLSSQFFLFIILEQALSVVASCFVISFHNNDKPMPKWFKTLVNTWLARIVLMQDEKKTSVRHCQNGNDLFTKYFDHFAFENNEVFTIPDKETKTTDVEKEKQKAKEIVDDHAVRNMQKELVKLQEKIAVLSDKFRCINDREKRQNEWTRAAAVLDRFFLCLLIVITVISFPAIFLSLLNSH